MLNQSYFYHSTIKKYIVAFAHLLDDIHVQRTDEEGVLIKDIKIPISYGQKSKLFHVLETVKNRKYDLILPRIDFELNQMTPDPTRQKNIVNTIDVDDGDNSNYTFNGISYRFIFDVALICKYLGDLYQGVEQILSFFTPDYQNIKVDLIPELNISPNVKILFTDVTLDINQDFDEDTYRTCEANFVFELHGWLYKPIKITPKINNIIIGISDFDTDKVWSELTTEIDENNIITQSWDDNDQFIPAGD